MFNFSEKQILSLKESNAKINIWEGAVRSGKTFISLWRFLKELATGPEGEYAILARTQKNFKETIFPILFNIIGQDVRYYSHKTELHIWGKTIHTIGCDNDRAESKIRGPTFMGAYVDEATIIPESVFKMLISRCAMGESKIFATTNPDSPYHWLKTDFLNGNPDVKSWNFNFDDNPQLTQSEKDYLKRQYRGIWYNRFIEGKWLQAEGAIYDFFDEKVHCMDYPQSGGEYYIVGIDYGTTNPCAFILIGVNRRLFPKVWVEDEYYFDSRKEQRQKTDEEYATDLIKFTKGKYIKGIYIDPSAASFKAELSRRGFSNLYQANNDVLNGIRFTSDFLNLGSMKIGKNCTNLLKEIRSYVWDPKSIRTGQDKPLKENDHALDALRYAIYSHFNTGEIGKGLTPEDLDRIYREAMGDGQLPYPFNDDYYRPSVGF